MRIVGKREQYRITREPSAQRLIAGARWNDSMRRLAPGLRLPIRRGVYAFDSHEAADAAWQEIIVAGMVELARRRGWHD